MSLLNKENNSIHFQNFKYFDNFIQNCLDKFKFVNPRKEFYDVTGKDANLIISHKSTIPDLVIWNKTFNKNLCFQDGDIEKENPFPRYQFYLRIKGNKKDKKKNEDKNNNIQKIKKLNKIKKDSYKENGDLNNKNNQLKKQNNQTKEIGINGNIKDEEKINDFFYREKTEDNSNNKINESKQNKTNFNIKEESNNKININLLFSNDEENNNQEVKKTKKKKKEKKKKIQNSNEKNPQNILYNPNLTSLDRNNPNQFNLYYQLQQKNLFNLVNNYCSRKGWVIITKEGSILNQFTSFELFQFLSEQNKYYSNIKKITITDHDNHNMFDGEYIYFILIYTLPIIIQNRQSQIFQAQYLKKQKKRKNQIIDNNMYSPFYNNEYQKMQMQLQNNNNNTNNNGFNGNNNPIYII